MSGTDTVALTHRQALYLSGDETNGSPRGLIRKACLSYIWGIDPSLGYNVTELGKRSLAAYDAALAREQSL